MVHDELYVMNATIHAMNYVECYHDYQHHYHCLLTHNNLFLADLTTGTHSHTGRHQTTRPCLLLSSDASSYMVR